MGLISLKTSLPIIWFAPLLRDVPTSANLLNALLKLNATVDQLPFNELICNHYKTINSFCQPISRYIKNSEAYSYKIYKR